MIDFDSDEIMENSPALQGINERKQVEYSPEAEFEDIFGDIPDKEEELTIEETPKLKDINVDAPKTEGPKPAAKADPKKKEEDGFSMVQETIGAVAAGAAAAVENVGNSLQDAANWAASNEYSIFNLINKAEGKPVQDIELFKKEDRITALTNPENIPQPETLGGNLIKGVAQFVMPFGVASKGLKGIKAVSGMAQIAKTELISAGVGATAFDPHEARLSNLIQNYPILKNPVTEYLAASKSDTAAEGRMKNAVEGMGLGLLAEGLFFGLKSMKNWHVGKAVKADEAAVTKMMADEGIDEAAAMKAVKEKKIADTPDVDVRKLDDVIEKTKTPDDIERAIETKGEKILSKKDKKLKGESKKNVEILEDGKTFGEKFQESKRGVQSMEMIRKRAKLSGVDESNILERKIGKTADSVERVQNEIDYIHDEYSEMMGMVRDAKKSKSADDLAAARARIQRYETELAHMDGGISEAMRVGAVVKHNKGKLEGSRKVKAYLEDTGGMQSTEQMMDRLIAIDDTLGIEGMGKVLGSKKFMLMKDAVAEVYINGLLSGPKTHIVNITSNTSVTASAIVETAAGRLASKVTAGAKGLKESGLEGFKKGFSEGTQGGVAKGEAQAHLAGILNSISDGAKLATEALKKGQISEGIKLDELPSKAISSSRVKEAFPSSAGVLDAKVLGQESLLGNGLDLFGEIVRSPGRALLAADEFFKHVNSRGHLAQLATREAREMKMLNGWSEAQTLKHMEDLMQNPTKGMQRKAAEFGRVQTFTNQLEGLPKKLDEIIKKDVSWGGVAPLRAVLPFVRTPINVVQYTWDRIPIKDAAGMFFENSKIRKALRTGGAERDMAVARLATGSSVMAMTSFMAANGLVTGNGPANKKARKIWLLENQPNSIRIGDKSFQYDKIAPWGAIMGMAADMSMLFQEMGEDNELGKQEALAVGVGLIAEKIPPEFLAENLGTFLNIFSGDDNAMKTKKTQSFLANMGAGLVPFSGFRRNLTQAIDPVRRETRANPDAGLIGAIWEETRNKIMATMPGLSDNLPPKRNIFGDEIPIAGPVSPITMFSKKNDVVANEMIRLGMNSVLDDKKPVPGETFLTVDMPQRHISKTVAGKRITQKLDPEQYDRIVQLSAGIDLEGVDMTLHEALSDEVDFQEISSSISKGGEPTDEAKRLAIKSIISMYRKLAREQFLQEERDIIDDFEEEATMREEAF